MEKTPHQTDLNLVTHRATTSVWDRRGWDGTRDSAVTRWLVATGGAALAVEGLRRRGASGSFFAALGGGLVGWALTGEGDLSGAERWFNRILDYAPWNRAVSFRRRPPIRFPQATRRRGRPPSALA